MISPMPPAGEMTGVTPAGRMLREYETTWHGDVRPAFREYAY